MAFCQPYERQTYPMRGINRVARSPNCSTECLLGLWYGQGLLWPFVWPTGHTAWLAVSTSVANGLGHPGYPGRPGHFFAGHLGLTHFIKYPGLTWILYWIMCVINGIWK